MTKQIDFTSLQLRKTINAISCYRHDMKHDLDDIDSIVLISVQNKLVKKYKEIRPDFIPFY